MLTKRKHFQYLLLSFSSLPFLSLMQCIQCVSLCLCAHERIQRNETIYKHDNVWVMTIFWTHSMWYRHIHDMAVTLYMILFTQWSPVTHTPSQVTMHGNVMHSILATDHTFVPGLIWSQKWNSLHFVPFFCIPHYFPYDFCSAKWLQIILHPSNYFPVCRLSRVWKVWSSTIHLHRHWSR